jgi:hypothetical protein
MANEHTLIIQTTIPKSFTVADGVAITKGTVLKLTDPNTASASAAANDTVAGIAYTDKIASNGITQLAVVTGPGDEFRAIASGSITVGDALVTAIGPTSNYLASAGLNVSGSAIIGTSRESATVGETFRYVLNIGGR